MARYTGNLIDGGSELTPRTKSTAFKPIADIVDRYGDVVSVDAQGKDKSGNVVIAGPDQSKVGGPSNTSMIVDAGLGTGATIDLTKSVTGPTSGAANVGPTTARALLEVMLRTEGIPDDLIASSVDFLSKLDDEGIDDPTDMIDIYMNNKTFTTKSGAVLTSPFYNKYTALGDGVINPNTNKKYTPRELFAWRTGVEDVISRYNLSNMFAGDDVLKKLVRSNRSVKDFEADAQTAVLAELEADPNKITALQKMGYIKSGQGLRNFYLNPEIGQVQLEQDKAAAAFATEAVRYSGYGIGFNAERIKQIAATYGAQSEAQAQESASKLYGAIAPILKPVVKLAGIYAERPSGKVVDMQTEESMTPRIQAELENEQIYGLESQLRKRVQEQNIRAFQGQAGTAISGEGLLSQRAISTAGMF